MDDFDVRTYDSKPHGFFRTLVIMLLLILIALAGAILIKEIQQKNEVTKVITEIHYINDSDTASIADLYEEVKDGVVVILNQTVTSTGSEVYETTAGGSGFVISDEGYIVTNYHVIGTSASLTVKFNDGTAFPATVVGYDADLDVALLKIDPGKKKLKVLKIGDATMSRTGDSVFVIGFTTSEELFGSLTSGRISYNNRILSDSDAIYIQTEASINPGNSGGPLFNMNGEVIGISKSKIASAKVDNICFAISSVTFKPIIDRLLEIKPTTRVGIGISGVAVEDMGETEILGDGVVVATIFSDGPASLAGIKIYDIIVELDGKPVKRVENIRAILENHADGDVVNITVVRGTKENRLTFPITLRNVEFYEEETEK